MSRVLTHFKPCEDIEDHFVCQLCVKQKKVAKPLSGKSKPNLRSHMSKTHPKEYKEFCDPSKKYSLAEKRKIVMQSFAEIVTVNGRPFEYLKDSGFQRLIKCDLEELSDGGMPINFSDNYQELKSYIAHLATTIKTEIIEDLKNQHISILMDLGTKNNISFLGINSQCMINDDVVIHSLGVIPMDGPHTAKYIQEKFTDCLKDFGIEEDSVVSLTTDNGRNLIATTNNFDAHLKEICENAIGGDNRESGSVQRQTNAPELNQISDLLDEHDLGIIFAQAADDEEMDRIMNDENDFDELFSEVCGNIQKSTFLVNTVRCGAHTIQLMVIDAIKVSSFYKVLCLSRSIVKLLRTHKFQYEARDAGIQYTPPLIFCTTRWDADYLMVIMKSV